MSRFIIVALLLHLPLFAYPVLRLSSWLELSVPLTTTIFIPVFFSQIFARKVLYEKQGVLAFALRNAADFILGVAPVVLLLLITMEMVIWFSPLAEYDAALLVLVLSAFVIITGVFKAFNPQVVKISLKSNKIGKPYRFVQITDVHIGSRSSRFLTQLMDRINQLDADFLCITGDFIDQPGITEQQLTSLQTFKGPIYYTIGNHERYEDLDDILKRLTNLGVNILRNSTTEYEGLQLIGIDDRDDVLQVGKVLPTINVNQSSYSILLYHRPVGLEACAEHGVDLMLSGHTHGGQIIPFNLIVNKVFDRVSGLFTHRNSTLYVSQGTGTWGPVLRVGTKSEITVFELGHES